MNRFDCAGLSCFGDLFDMRAVISQPPSRRYRWYFLDTNCFVGEPLSLAATNGNCFALRIIDAELGTGVLPEI